MKSQIMEVVDRFVAELREIALKTAMDTLAEQLHGRGSNGHARATTSVPAKTGGKRSSEAIEELQNRVLAHIKSHPGHRVEEIKAALGMTTKDLALPIKKLIADKEVKTTGQKRSTAYYMSDAEIPEQAPRGARKRSKSKSK